MKSWVVHVMLSIDEFLIIIFAFTITFAINIHIYVTFKRYLKTYFVSLR